MTTANNDTSARLIVPTIRPDDIVDAVRPYEYDEVAQLQYDTLACIAKNVTENIETVAGYTENWTYAEDGEPGSYAIYSIMDMQPWDKPLVEILRNDPFLADWKDSSLRNLAVSIRAAALKSTHTRCATLEKYDSYDIQATVA